MKDLKKYKIPIIGGISGLLGGWIAFTNFWGLANMGSDMITAIGWFGIGAITAFIIDKVWK